MSRSHAAIWFQLGMLGDASQAHFASVACRALAGRRAPPSGRESVVRDARACSGDHWLGSFAIYLMTAQRLPPEER